jgi:cytochrome bd-type quinol oxidase subunit 1
LILFVLVYAVLIVADVYLLQKYAGHSPTATKEPDRQEPSMAAQ